MWTNPSVAASIDCGKAGDGQLAVPFYILPALPPGSGGVTVQNEISLRLSPGGLDIGVGEMVEG